MNNIVRVFSSDILPRLDFTMPSGPTTVGGVASVVWNNMAAVADWAFTLGMVVGLIGIVYGGLMYSMAGANPANASKGKTSITNSIIGTAICMLGSMVMNTIYNWLQSSTAPELVITISQKLAAITGAVAFTMLIYGALLYTMGGANPANAAKGKQAIIYACIGIIIAVGAFGILSYVQGLILQSGGLL